MGIFGAIGGAFKSAGKAIKKGAKKVGKKVGKAGKSAFKAVKKVKKVASVVEKAATSAVKNVKKVAKKTVGKVLDKPLKLAGQGLGAVADVALDNPVGKLGKKLAKKGLGAAGKVVGGSTVEAVLRKLHVPKDIARVAVGVGRIAADVYSGGAISAAEAAVASAKDVVSGDLDQLVRSAIDSGVDSVVSKGMGRLGDAVGGLANVRGVRENLEKLREASDKVQQVYDGVQSLRDVQTRIETGVRFINDPEQFSRQYADDVRAQMASAVNLDSLPALQEARYNARQREGLMAAEEALGYMGANDMEMDGAMRGSDSIDPVQESKQALRTDLVAPGANAFANYSDYVSQVRSHIGAAGAARGGAAAMAAEVPTLPDIGDTPLQVGPQLANVFGRQTRRGHTGGPRMQGRNGFLGRSSQKPAVYIPRG